MHSYNKTLLQFKSDWQMELVEMLIIDTSWIYTQRLISESRLWNSCLVMLITQRWWMIRMMFHTNGSAWSNLPPIFLHCQLLGVPAGNFSVLSTSHSADFSASSHSYSLCAVSICDWKLGSSYVFQRWILWLILPFMMIDILSAEATALINYKSLATSYPPWWSSAMIGALQSPSVPLSLDWHVNISF